MLDNDAQSILRGIRNGAAYGTKTRAPHGTEMYMAWSHYISHLYKAFVMIFLFSKGTTQSKLRRIIGLTYEHTKNLALFVGLYKCTLVLLKKYTNARNKAVRLPAQHWHAALAGFLGGYFAWGKYTSVNNQVVMYLLARNIYACFRLLAARDIAPFNKFSLKTHFPLISSISWAMAMWLFESDESVLQESLKRSMDFIYRESSQSSQRIRDFLPTPATALVLAIRWFGV
uniref:Uncharacterized protein AlNc14C14G1636 n=1 Tax=Albugo laibachii Nc14 TaxID=890382 RepID=F0W3R0_9STRA|nr:conserved hypothetical protein [Albugo laibachii Nc14]|eukprot:CCA15730.1 conserved hypothetical protein [Albugo laibachii Nc14]